MVKRNGLQKKSTERICAKVLEQGTRRTQTKGRLRKWLDSKWHNAGEDREYIVYGQDVYVFSNASALITVMHIPSDLVKDCKKMQK